MAAVREAIHLSRSPPKSISKGQGWWLVSDNHWNFDVISNANVAENRLAEPVPLAGLGKHAIFQR